MVNDLPSTLSAGSMQGASSQAAMTVSQIANAVVQANNNSAGVIPVQGEWDVFPVPQAMTQVITSATGGGALAKNAYFGNEATFNATPTNNGSGGGSMTNTYGDGFHGLGYDKLITAMPRGVQCYGFTLQYIVTASGVQDQAALATANPTIIVANLVGANFIPSGQVLSSGARNNQYLSGIMTIAYKFKLNALSQFQYNVPVGDTVTLTLLTSPF